MEYENFDEAMEFISNWPELAAEQLISMRADIAGLTAEIKRLEAQGE